MLCLSLLNSKKAPFGHIETLNESPYLTTSYGFVIYLNPFIFDFIA